MSKEIQILDATEIGKLLIHLTPLCDSTKEDHKTNRNLLLFLLMLDAGLRVGELVQLVVFDLFLQGKSVTTLTIRAKTAKTKTERNIPLSCRLMEVIEAFFDNRPGYVISYPNGPVFKSGTRDTAVSVRQVQRIVRSIALKAIGRAIHPHVLRHTFATRLMTKTSIRVVQQLLGHKSITSTQIYTHPNSTDLQEAINAI